MSIEEVSERYELKVDAVKPQLSTGLSSELAAKRLSEYGHNIMTPPKEIPLVVRYLICLSNLFNMLLIVSGILCYILYGMDPVENFANVR
jgi:sodium/potassium-transporting ATPase subunit alpha